jgi:type IV secretion system protein VirD4
MPALVMLNFSEHAAGAFERRHMTPMVEFVAVFVLIAWAYRHTYISARNKRVRQAWHGFNPVNVHGGARFAGNDDLRKAGLFGGKGVPIGYSPDGKHALHYPGFGHILTIAASRMGKGATLLINALLSWRGSCISIDPKCENAVISGHSRLRFGAVYVLNPFNMLPDALRGLMQARFNPMDILDTASHSFHAVCDKLAAALVWDDAGREGMHFTTAARVLVSGVIAALKRHGAAWEQNLAMVARVISGDIRGFCLLTVQSTTDPFIIQKLQRFAYADPQNKEVNDVISTAIVQLGFLFNAAMAECLSGSDFRFADLKRRIVTVYICLPLNMLDVSDKFFRLVLEVALWDLLNEGQRGAGKRVLCIVDEMAQLGPHMKSLENVQGMGAGAAGILCWGVLQDLSQLKGMFPNTWETFIQNCGVTQFFGARDESTREYVSKLSGTCEILSRSRSVSIDHRTGEPHVNESSTQQARPLLLPHEVGQLAPDQMIQFVEGVRCGPVCARRKFYFHVFPRHLFRSNPYVRNDGGGFFG